MLEDTYTVLVFTSVAIPQTKTKRERDRQTGGDSLSSVADFSSRLTEG